ncbi:hypothetical protein MPTK2_2g18345 [Marchantia polymorpha subsp. ruderalis]
MQVHSFWLCDFNKIKSSANHSQTVKTRKCVEDSRKSTCCSKRRNQRHILCLSLERHCSLTLRDGEEFMRKMAKKFAERAADFVSGGKIDDAGSIGNLKAQQCLSPSHARVLQYEGPDTLF